MSADVINLRRVRKSKARDDKRAEADRNRVAFGRTKAEKQQARAERDRAGKALDAHKREKP